MSPEEANALTDTGLRANPFFGPFRDMSVCGTNGSALSSGAAYYTYEPHRDLLSQVRNDINGGTISQYDYVNDALGRRTAIIRSGSMMSESFTNSYSYNQRNELIFSRRAAENAEEYSYQYDTIGSRLSSTEIILLSTNTVAHETKRTIAGVNAPLLPAKRDICVFVDSEARR